MVVKAFLQRNIVLAVFLFGVFFTGFVPSALAYTGTVSPTSASAMSSISLGGDASYQYWLLYGDYSASEGTAYAVFSATGSWAFRCAYKNGPFTTDAGAMYALANSVGASCPALNTSGVWSVYETDTGAGHNSFKTFTISAPPPAPVFGSLFYMCTITSTSSSCYYPASTTPNAQMPTYLDWLITQGVMIFLLSVVAFGFFFQGYHKRGKQRVSMML